MEGLLGESGIAGVVGWAVVSGVVEWPAVWAVVGPGARGRVRRRGGGVAGRALAVSVVGGVVSGVVAGVLGGVVRGLWEERSALTEGWLRSAVFGWQTSPWEGFAVWAGLVLGLTAVDGVVLLGARRAMGRGGGGWPIERVLGVLAIGNGASVGLLGWLGGGFG